MRDINIAVIKGFIKYFCQWEIEETAKRVGLIKRRDGKLLPETFLKAFTIGIWNSQYSAMSQIVQLCEDIQEGLSITKQALHKKLNAGAEFMNLMFNLSMTYSMKHSSVTVTSNVLSLFNNVVVCDSTYITLPDKLRQFFKGVGGKGKSDSALKVQAEYNLTKRSFRSLRITEGIDNDQGYVSRLLDTVQENDLVIQDMGYFSLKFFKDIKEQKAYFLTRLPNHIAFFTDLEISKEKPLPLENILDVNKAIIDKQIFIGREKNSRICVRLVAIRLPTSVANERIRKANKKAQSRGKALTKRQKLLLAWNIVLTNIPYKMLSTEQVIDLYKIRWQIEIIFKAWKSYLRLENIGHGGKSQVECLLYGRLIVITMLTTIYSQFYLIMFIKEHRELSILKFFSMLTLKARDITIMICTGVKKLYALVAIFLKVAEKCLYDKRNRRSTLELISSHQKLILEDCG